MEGEPRFHGNAHVLLAGESSHGRSGAGSRSGADQRAGWPTRQCADPRAPERSASDGQQVALLVGSAGPAGVRRRDVVLLAIQLEGIEAEAHHGPPFKSSGGGRCVDAPGEIGAFRNYNLVVHDDWLVDSDPKTVTG